MKVTPDEIKDENGEAIEEDEEKPEAKTEDDDYPDVIHVKRR
jgi:hypothetical protein